ncbi:sensor histidine kinase [Bacteroides ihuae]|uniref:sensor histidine kinase n=1 Tax=Bacteroides ihuae TaxID=1852362 RepID=UPI0008DA7282
MSTLYRLTMILILVGTSLTLAAKERSYKILFIQSYAESDSWAMERNKGLRRGFEKGAMNVEITTEYLNARCWVNVAEEEIMRRICLRATERGTDLIIASNDEALYSLLVCGDSLPKRVPVVYFGVEYPNQNILNKYTNVTGFQNPKSFVRLLGTAKEMFPNRKKIVVVSDNSYLGRVSMDELRAQLAIFAKNNPDYQMRQFNIHTDQMTDILYEIQISQTASKSILIMPYWGLFMPSIAKVSKSPCFTVTNESLTRGGFCSLAPSPYDDARRAGMRAADLLRGANVSSLGYTQSEVQLTFDYKQLNFFHVPKQIVPEDSVIMNEPYWEKYKFLFILLYSSSLLLLVFLVVVLFRAKQREFRKRIEAQTRLLLQNKMVDQRNNFDNIFHSIHEGVISYGKDLKIRFVNQSASKMLNINVVSGRGSFEGLPAGTYLRIYNKGQDILYSILNQVAETGKSVFIPEDSFMKEVDTGNYFPVSGEFVPIYQKSQLSGFVLSFRNISDEELQKRSFHLAVEDNSVYPWQYDVAKKTFLFPIGFLKRFGFDENEKYITRSQISRLIHPDYVDEVSLGFDAVLNGEKKSLRQACKICNVKGDFEWWEYRMSVFMGLTVDVPYSILGVCQSIQRYKNTEEELIAARDKALQSDNLKTAFLANISHEIRTPLNSIVGFSDLLKDIHSFSDEEILQFVTTINTNCELLLSLINDILDMSRIESGTLDFQSTNFNLSLIIDDIYQSQQLGMPAKVSLIKVLPEDEPKWIVSDPVRIKQLLNNLINNAAKFTHQGSITFGYLLEEPGYTTLFVEDTGSGISEEDQKHIFDRFYKVDNFSQGAGLGLSICRTIVEHMHGEIYVNSEKGKGSRFTIRIPDNQN